jgi:hypothetical protein
MDPEMTRRSFTVHSREGCQRTSLATITAPGQATTKLAGMDDGDYTIRDCLGGLRLIVRVTNGTPTVIERTPT